jgi:SAM-dependent methyltransferase
MTELVSKHYDQEYFELQSPSGEFGGWANQTKFINNIHTHSEVLDFGCGGGYLLSGMHCAKKVGVEVNESAMEVAKSNGIEVYRSVAEVPDDYVDVIISDNAIEHTLHPLLELKSLCRVLRSGGKIIFVVPCESIGYKYKPNDFNHHLYTWSPMCIGNLFTEAGFSVIESKPYIHKWPPYYRQIARLGGRSLFDVVCRIYGRLNRLWFQVRVIAEKQVY